MANSMFAGSSPVEDSSVILNRRTSRANSTAFNRRTSQEGGSFSLSHVSPLSHVPWMAEALAEARASQTEGGIPIGCVLLRHGQIVGRGRNRRIQKNSNILHAEIDCLENAGQQPASFFHECTLYTTLSPNALSAGAIRFYGIPRVVIGDHKNFHGDEASLKAAHINVDFVECRESEELLENFIKNNQALWNENIARDAH